MSTHPQQDMWSLLLSNGWTLDSITRTEEALTMAKGKLCMLAWKRQKPGHLYTLAILHNYNYDDIVSPAGTTIKKQSDWPSDDVGFSSFCNVAIVPLVGDVRLLALQSHPHYHRPSSMQSAMCRNATSRILLPAISASPSSSSLRCAIDFWMFAVKSRTWPSM
jgi:hypothetical protein